MAQVLPEEKPRSRRWNSTVRREADRSNMALRRSLSMAGADIPAGRSWGHRLFAKRCA
ncbi:MAG: hypothetical protein ACREFX_03400 [Opitutaceae bacterium]